MGIIQCGGGPKVWESNDCCAAYAGFLRDRDCFRETMGQTLLFRLDGWHLFCPDQPIIAHLAVCCRQVLVQVFSDRYLWVSICRSLFSTCFGYGTLHMSLRKEICPGGGLE